MATGVSSTHSTDDVKENIYSCCSSCKKNDRNTRAGYYCVDCEMYFCTKCLKYHYTFPSLKSHQVNDVQSLDSTNAEYSVQSEEETPVPPEALKCILHPDKLIDTYCKEHDETCCEVCAVIKHRLCTTNSIKVAAKNFNSNPEVNTSKRELSELLNKLKQEQIKRMENIDHIEKVKLEMIKNVDNYEEQMNEKVKTLANALRNDIRSKLEAKKIADYNDTESLDVVITNTELQVNKLEQMDDEVLFRSVKMSKIVTTDLSSLLQAMTADWRKTEVNINFDQTLENLVDKLQSIGQLVESEYRATFQKKVIVKRSTDTHYNEVVDMCKMDSGDLLLVDHSNRKLKRFNGDFQFIDEICLSGEPIAVCKINKDEVAVRIWDTKVVFIVSVGQSMKILLLSEFTLADNGRGMTYDASSGEILACEENKVSVYSKTGVKLRTYDTYTNGEQMFSACRQIVVNEKEQKIYVTDQTKGLIILDKNGTSSARITLDITSAWPLCILPGDVCLVGSVNKGAFVQIIEDKIKDEKIINGIDEHTKTYCALYDHDHTRLIIGGKPNVCVYTLSRHRE